MKANKRQCARFAGIIAISACFLVIYFNVREAWGAEPQLPSEIIVFKKGICTLSPAGIMVEKGEGLYERKCAIGINPKNPAMRYITTYDNEGNIESVIEGNPARVQRVIYRRGAAKI